MLCARAQNGLVRTAVRLVRGVEVSFKDGVFHMAVTSPFAWFKASITIFIIM
jgi:hypothetical protein